ncbi:nuclear transport factor 2 family protein [Arhodomonas sp. SL1]|uniref:nuclear transport factor 2 family protein n=1 Tax=Arhodomonas sp. SL1 TaxID=3425691 RepID=UPI003F8828F6
MQDERSHTEVLQAVFEAFNRHDADAVVAYMTEDCVFETAGGAEAHGTRIQGREAVRDAFAQVWQGLPDVQWRNARHFAAADRGVSEWTFVATRPDGYRIEAEGCDLFRFRDGLICEKKAFRKDRPLLAPDAD